MTIQESIRVLANTGGEAHCKICQVIALDSDARTIDCMPIDDGAPLLGVNLQANQGSKYGVVIYPTVGSYVVVSFIGVAVAVVIVTDQIDKIEMQIGGTTIEATDQGVVFNGGELGGLIKVRALTEKLNTLIDAFNAHTHSIPTGAVAVTGSATAQANPAPVVVPVISLKHQKVSVSDYENDKIKH